MAELAPLAMPRRSIVVVAARFLVAGRLLFGDLASMSRYEPDENLRKILDSHVRRGLLVDNGNDVFTPSQPFQSGARLVLRLQSEEAERLWSSTSALPHLTGLARLHVAVALESDAQLDAFRRQTEVHDTAPQTDAGQLLAHVTELRYLRSDIHATCLGEEGLSGPGARMLHRLWRGFDVDGDIDPTLIAAHLVDADAAKLSVTARGREVCERVEAATNEGFARLFDALGESQSSDFLHGMRGLPGEDPRPAQDR